MKSVNSKLDFTGDIIVGMNPTIISSNINAENGTIYNVVANTTITDPTGIEGEGYEVKIINGSAIIGSTTYSIPGSIINRIFEGGSWNCFIVGIGGNYLPVTDLGSGAYKFHGTVVDVYYDYFGEYLVSAADASYSTIQEQSSAGLGIISKNLTTSDQSVLTITPDGVGISTNAGPQALFKASLLTAAQTYQLPDHSDTLATLSDISTSGGAFIKQDGTSAATTGTIKIGDYQGLAWGSGVKISANDAGTKNLYLEVDDVGYSSYLSVSKDSVVIQSAKSTSPNYSSRIVVQSDRAYLSWGSFTTSQYAVVNTDLNGVGIRSTNSYYSYLRTDNLTADQTHQLPINSGTLALTSDIATALGAYLPLAGGLSMTGNYNLHADATSALQPVTFQQLQSFVTGLWDDRGNYDASGNIFPTSGGSGTSGAILKGDIWTISVAGTLGGKAVKISDTVRALVDTPGSTSSNWALGQGELGYTPLSNVLNSTLIFVGNSSNVATGVNLTLSGTAGSFALGNTGILTMPNATNSLRGLLTATDWTTFNSKQAALGFTPENVANKVGGFGVLNNTLYPTTQAVQDNFLPAYNSMGPGGFTSINDYEYDYDNGAGLTGNAYFGSLFQFTNSNSSNDVSNFILQAGAVSLLYQNSGLNKQASISVSNQGITLIGTTSNIGAVLDTSLLTASYKTFSFQNQSGTFALINAPQTFTAKQTFGGTYVGTGSGSFNIFDINAQLTLGTSNTFGHLQAIDGTLIASANGQTLSGLYIAPIFTNGAFTGVTNNYINLGNKFKVNAAGTVMIANFTAAGVVTNDASGNLGTSTGTGYLKSTAGVISYDNTVYNSGAGTAGQVAYYNGTNSLTSDSAFLYSSGILTTNANKIVGTAGAGFIEYAYQSSRPAAVNNTIRVYASSVGGWGHVKRNIANSADIFREMIFPDASATITFPTPASGGADTVAYLGTTNSFSVTQKFAAVGFTVNDGTTDRVALSAATTDQLNVGSGYSRLNINTWAFQGGNITSSSAGTPTITGGSGGLAITSTTGATGGGQISIFSSAFTLNTASINSGSIVSYTGDLTNAATVSTQSTGGFVYEVGAITGGAGVRANAQWFMGKTQMTIASLNGLQRGWVLGNATAPTTAGITGAVAIYGVSGNLNIRCSDNTLVTLGSTSQFNQVNIGTTVFTQAQVTVPTSFNIQTSGVGGTLAIYGFSSGSGSTPGSKVYIGGAGVTGGTANGESVYIDGGTVTGAGLRGGLVLFNATTTPTWNSLQRGILIGDATAEASAVSTIGTYLWSFGQKLKSSGSLAFPIVGAGVEFKTGTNARAGSSTLAAGTVTVANTSITANSQVVLTARHGTTPFELDVTYTAATGFVITSANIGDTRIVDWFIIERI